MTNKLNPNSFNPYDVLGVSPAASKAEINKAVTLAMKRKQYSVEVIAKAQKSLMKSEERIIADYLRPILPSIKRFKYSDFSALEQPEPEIILLSEFDGLDDAITKANQEEMLAREPLPIPLSELLNEGITACQEKRYPKAVKILEDYCQSTRDRNSNDYTQAQIYLIRAYQMTGQKQRAIHLCSSLINHSNAQIKAWANNYLSLLSKEVTRV
ncbi:hypothetical protein DSM106972_085960 [Dulcicalothrix desertica PCC 7102]|uniref:Uncharacterized protein n=1 Tax=Dulcicalothrix desertica PCC 7102 TaxID=232991 RepID=A0A433UTB4_9CYAN|nr:molecular chaperone DnaJ [Dulcicalothrix desertica]RUS97046.1 hypothetical protein DSM106972_085960 [Dulcicalothrix desertica PCC 7102]TWH54019.1 hypothetical protein CAL7102_02019 [Dulcicalothrix desertica PCC 7102]